MAEADSTFMEFKQACGRELYLMVGTVLLSPDHSVHAWNKIRAMPASRVVGEYPRNRLRLEASGLGMREN